MCCVESLGTKAGHVRSPLHLHCFLQGLSSTGLGDSCCSNSCNSQAKLHIRAISRCFHYNLHLWFIWSRPWGLKLQLTLLLALVWPGLFHTPLGVYLLQVKPYLRTTDSSGVHLLWHGLTHSHSCFEVDQFQHGLFHGAQCLQRCSCSSMASLTASSLENKPAPVWPYP